MCFKNDASSSNAMAAWGMEGVCKGCGYSLRTAVSFLAGRGWRIQPTM